MRRFTTLVALVLALAGGMSLFPARAGAADPSLDYMEFQIQGNSLHMELFPEYAFCQPNGLEGNGDLMRINVAGGALRPSPQGQQLLAELGGTCEFQFTNPTQFQVSSASAKVLIQVDGKPLEAPSSRSELGMKHLTIVVKRGQDLSGLRVQLETIFPSLDPSTPTKALDNGIYFKETGHNVEPVFMGYWQTHGGLKQFGYPISEPGYEVLEDGDFYLVQYFERARFEYHPENPSNLRILLGQFGREIHGTENVSSAVKDDSYRYYAQTGHNVPEMFWRYWDANGGLSQFGYPISEPRMERLADGNVYLVQYFERARFEYHPENQHPYDILLGQFGRQMLDSLAEIRAESSR